MIKVCAKGPVTKGIDVSRWQSQVDWAALKKVGVEFCFVKATEGATVVDHMFSAHTVGAKGAGLLVGAYHFYHPAADPITQAHNFVNIASLHVGKADLPLVMDWETTDGVPSQADRAAGLKFLHEVERLTGKKPIIYGAPYFLQALGLDPQFAAYALWIAHYGVACPLVPAPWKGWTLWQVNEQGIDHDVFNGTFEELKALCG